MHRSCPMLCRVSPFDSSSSTSLVGPVTRFSLRSWKATAERPLDDTGTQYALIIDSEPMYVWVSELVSPVSPNHGGDE